MNKLYDVDMSISKEMYTKDVLLKVAYLFSNRAYIHIELSENGNWQINMKMKDGFGPRVMVCKTLFILLIKGFILREEV